MSFVLKALPLPTDTHLPPLPHPHTRARMDHAMMNHAMTTVASAMDHMMNGSAAANSSMGMSDHHHHHDHDHHMMHGGNTSTSTVDHSMHNHNPAGTGTDMGSMDHGNMAGMDMPGMKMYFHDGVNEYVLFKECETKSTEALVGACFAVFAVAVLYEGLKYFRESLLQRSLIQTQSVARYLDGKQTPSSSHEQMVVQGGNVSMLNRMLSGGHFVQTFLHMLQVFISYCLMLVFMTYNVWLCLSVVVGAGVGYFLFGWKRAVVVDANEHCH